MNVSASKKLHGGSGFVTDTVVAMVEEVFWCEVIVFVEVAEVVVVEVLVELVLVTDTRCESIRERIHDKSKVVVR